MKKIFILVFLFSFVMISTPKTYLINCTLYNPSNNPCMGYLAVTNYIAVPDCDLETTIVIECAIEGSFTKTAILRVYDPNNEKIFEKIFTFYNCLTTLNSTDTILFTANGQYRVEVIDPDSEDGVGFDVTVNQTH